MKTPGIPLDKIAPDVEPIVGERGRYYVRSKSDPSKVYLVDLLENDFMGKCNCPQFEFRIQGDITRNGLDLELNQRCRHIRRAERYFIEMMKRALWLERGEQKPAPRRIQRVEMVPVGQGASGDWMPE